MTEAFPEIAQALASVEIDAVLDAELVVPDGRGRADFEQLRRRAFMRRPAVISQAAAARPAALVVFDVLHAGGHDLRVLPLAERKAWLAANLRPCVGIQVIDSVETHGEALFALAVEQRFEGIVAKRLDVPYAAGTHASWQTSRRASRRAVHVLQVLLYILAWCLHRVG